MYVHINVDVCIYMSVREYVLPVYVCMYGCTGMWFVCMCMCGCVRVCICVGMCMTMCFVSLWGCICMDMYVHMHMRVCI